MIKTKEVLINSKPESHRNLPKVIKWKGINMVRNHSFLAAINEIVTWAEEIDVTRVGIVGDMHSGKSTMAEAIGCAIHHKSKVPWAVRVFGEKQLMNFEETLKTLQPANYILRFDDVSFLDAKNNKKQINLVKEAITKIRHLEGGQDVKIILIYNYHYTMGLDKYLRQADFRFFTTVGSSERENMEKIVGSKRMKVVDRFAEMRQRGVVKKHFGMRIGPKEIFSYKWRDPFIPVLFYNNDTLRLIISPKREFMHPICPVCTMGQSLSNEVDIKQFLIEYEQKFSPSTCKAVVKQKLKEQGIDTYSPTYVQARRYFERALEQKQLSLENVAIEYEMKPTKTRLRKKLDGVLK